MKFISRCKASVGRGPHFMSVIRSELTLRGITMADRFTDLQMLKLVETYRDYPCLWDVTSDLYKNRNARDSAYKEIWKKLNISGLSIKDIPKKIKNMRSSYYQELKRIQKSRRSGAGQDSVYKPKVSWFAAADGFLRIFRNKRERFSNFLNLYQKEPSLWNTSSIEHKNRDDTYDAWNRIKRQLGPGDIPIKEIKRKRDNLMSTYRRLRSKVEKTKRATNDEAICEPDWPFYNFMANFLHDIYNPRKTSPSGLGPVSLLHNEESNLESDEEVNCHDETITPSKKPLKRKNTNSPNNPKKPVEESNSKDTNQEDNDECKLYTTLLCKKLKALKESTREIAMLEIDRYIYNLKQQEKSQEKVTPGLLQPMELQYPKQYHLSPHSEYSSSQHSPEYKNVFPIKLSPSSEHNYEQQSN